MPTQTIAGHTVELDEQGYLTDASQWNRDIAQAFASEAGIELNDDHWTIIDFCRSDAAEQGSAPGLRRITKQTGIKTKTIYKLFPGGPGKLAAKLSGLKKPQSCV